MTTPAEPLPTEPEPTGVPADEMALLWAADPETPPAVWLETLKRVARHSPHPPARQEAMRRLREILPDFTIEEADKPTATGGQGAPSPDTPPEVGLRPRAWEPPPEAPLPPLSQAELSSSKEGLSSRQAELAILGMMMTIPDVQSEIIKQLEVVHFGDQINRRLYATICELYRRGRPATPDSVQAAYTLQHGELEASRLDECLRAVRGPDPTVLIELLQTQYCRRLLTQTATQTLSALRDPAADVERVLDHLKSSLRDVQAPGPASVPGVLELHDFLAQDSPQKWLIPGLMEEMDRLILVGYEGRGKALALDTPIPTPDGWCTMAELRVGDKVWHPSGRPTQVVATWASPAPRACYEVWAAGAAPVVADAEHLWAVQCAPDGPTQLLTSAQMAQALQNWETLWLPAVAGLPGNLCPPLPARPVASVNPVTAQTVRCIQVDADDGMFLAGRAMLPTHNSMLLRQLALMSAAGLHPFTCEVMQPVRVLYIDMENAAALIRRKMNGILEQVRQAGTRVPPDTCFVWSCPGGLDLASRTDRGALRTAVEQSNAQMLVVGPLYKMIHKDPNAEETAMEVTSVIDDLRDRYSIAVIIEAHAPQSSGGQRELRPVASSVWLRWPEFGISMRPTDHTYLTMELQHWRGARDERHWPAAIKRGRTWPWEVVPDQEPIRSPDGIL